MSKRVLVFLGIFSLLLIALLAASAALVQLGILRTIGHGHLGWAALLPVLLYLVLSLRFIAARPKA